MSIPAFRPTSDPAVIISRTTAFRTTWPNAAARFENRLEAAEDLASTPGKVTQLSPDIYQVKSQSNPLGSYTVTISARSCTCPDHGKHASHGVICKHRLAVALFVGWDDPTPLEQMQLNIHSAEAEKHKLYAAFMETHPEAQKNIDFSTFSSYPVLGSVAYEHPNQGLLNIPCLAGRGTFESYSNQSQPAQEMIQLVALVSEPFATAFTWNTRYLTTRADRFTPAL